jgi:phytoene dehydrogenase-like protein
MTHPVAVSSPAYPAAAEVDAVVIGAGHNGLVGANLLADAGLTVLVLEGQPRIGGAIASDESLMAGYVTDWFSSFYPLAVASPVLRALDLDEWGLRWRHAPAALAHIFPDDRSAVLSRDLGTTAGSLAQFAPGDGQAWRTLVAEFDRIREQVLDALLTPFPPVRAASGLLRRLGAADSLRFARFAVTSVRRFGEERFAGEGATALLAGNALHSDLGPEAPASAFYGWLLAMLAQIVGFPVPEGGSGRIPEALRHRLLARGGTVRTSAVVARVDVRDGHVVGVRLANGERIATRTVLADVAAPALFCDLLLPQHVPPRLQRDLTAFAWDNPTLKLNWALAEPIPWVAPGARGAGTVHLGVDLAGMTMYSAALATGRLPEHPLVVLGQTTTADPSRSPHGTESAWAYTHLPHRAWHQPDLVGEQVKRLEEVVERHAPGFGARVLARSVQSPVDLEAGDANLTHGALGGGTSALHQQLLFRPVPGLARAETPIDGLYLASSSAHPGGGVHGGPGANAARAALARKRRVLGPARRRAIDLVLGRIYRD